MTMKQSNLRVWQTTRQNLKILAARLNLPMVKVLDALVRDALAKLEPKDLQP
jgi:hypothetical protein